MVWTKRERALAKIYVYFDQSWYQSNFRTFGEPVQQLGPSREWYSKIRAVFILKHESTHPRRVSFSYLRRWRYAFMVTRTGVRRSNFSFNSSNRKLKVCCFCIRWCAQNFFWMYKKHCSLLHPSSVSRGHRFIRLNLKSLKTKVQNPKFSPGHPPLPWKSVARCC